MPAPTDPALPAGHHRLLRHRAGPDGQPVRLPPPAEAAWRLPLRGNPLIVASLRPRPGCCSPLFTPPNSATACSARAAARRGLAVRAALRAPLGVAEELRKGVLRWARRGSTTRQRGISRLPQLPSARRCGNAPPGPYFGAWKLLPLSGLLVVAELAPPSRRRRPRSGAPWPCFAAEPPGAFIAVAVLPGKAALAVEDAPRKVAGVAVAGREDQGAAADGSPSSTPPS